MNFKTLNQFLTDYDTSLIYSSDVSKLQHTEMAPLLLLTMQEYFETRHSYPRPSNQEDADHFLELAKSKK